MKSNYRKIIDAELYREILKSEMFQNDDEHRLDIQRAIILLDQTPAVDLNSLRPEGEWIPICQRIYAGRGRNCTHYCSQCGQHGYDDYELCPSCGAKMTVINDV